MESPPFEGLKLRYRICKLHVGEAGPHQKKWVVDSKSTLSQVMVKITLENDLQDGRGK